MFKNLNRRQRFVGRLIIINLLLLAASLIWLNNSAYDPVAVAAAKGKFLLEMNVMAEFPFTAETAAETALANPSLAALAVDKELEFVNAVPLSYGESEPWREFGCGQKNCAHVTFYNYTDGGTVNSVINTTTNKTVGGWLDAAARPAGSPYVVDKAMAVAADNVEVTAVLGDIGAVDPAMVPMSAWLYDNACRHEWCVDLSFHDPAGSGRIFHVFVNMEQEKVARTFYTRSRPDRSTTAAPQPQRDAYSDGCNEQYGWEVCWEMTAHDGVNFRDATFQGVPIFSSIKIGQVEAWYPSWPGGYRDEIGFAASVPPFGGTQVNDLGDGFEVRQLFTEFTYWPNCICCYRYEQVLRFYQNGSFEARFVSHGPGCDDLSVYRPFWRIDMDLNGPDNDSVWAWQDTQWVEVTDETEFHPFVDSLSPDGHQLATFDGDIHYRWQMQRTDPLGLDESRFFALQKKEDEGAGPIVTGPGDTYQPPRQWIGDEPVSRQDVVFWFVPLLKTKKGGPYWCMPDPEPEFSPCEAVLRIEPGPELRQPTAEELAQPTPTLPATPTAVPTPAATPTPRTIEGNDPETIILNAGCGACHVIGPLGEAGKVGPELSNIGAVAGDRMVEVSAAEYLRQSIVAPNDFIAPDCPNGPCLANVMPQDYTSRMTPEQIQIVVEFLLALDEMEVAEDGVTVIGKNEIETPPTPAPKAFPAPKLNTARTQNQTANLAVQVLLLSLVFLLSLFRLLKHSPSE